jgi:L-asparagine oxygenase
MYQLVISTRQANLINRSFSRFIGDDMLSEETLSEIRATTESVFHDELLNKIGSLRDKLSKNGFLLIKGLDLINNLGSTPIKTDVEPNKKLASLAEVVHLGLGVAIGEPVAYEAEKMGSLIQHVFPVKSERKSPSNNSSAITLDLHTELVFSRRHPGKPLAMNSPDFILLFCLRSDPKREAITFIAEIEDICDHIDQDSLSILEQPQFELRAPYSFSQDDPQNRPWVGPVSLIENTKPLTAALDLACGTRGIDAKAEQALENMRMAAISNDIITNIRLEPNDLLVIDNRRCLHGRSPFPAMFDGNDRWIQRMYVRLSLRGMSPVDPRRSLRIF